MPDKEGSDDEKKSTKSVVNKRQKQMLNQEDYLPEEGYDIARDMGRVPKTKDKKDATTLPQSKREKIKGDTPMQKEFKKKYGKKATALDAVKQKYKGQIMDLKKEELDLTQVAEAFGGYIVEQDGNEKIRTSQTEIEKQRKRVDDLEATKKTTDRRREAKQAKTTVGELDKRFKGAKFDTAPFSRQERRYDTPMKDASGKTVKSKKTGESKREPKFLDQRSKYNVDPKTGVVPKSAVVNRLRNRLQSKVQADLQGVDAAKAMKAKQYKLSTDAVQDRNKKIQAQTKRRVDSLMKNIEKQPVDTSGKSLQKTLKKYSDATSPTIKGTDKRPARFVNGKQYGGGRLPMPGGYDADGGRTGTPKQQKAYDAKVQRGKDKFFKNVAKGGVEGTPLDPTETNLQFKYDKAQLDFGGKISPKMTQKQRDKVITDIARSKTMDAKSAPVNVPSFIKTKRKTKVIDTPTRRVQLKKGFVGDKEPKVSDTKSLSKKDAKKMIMQKRIARIRKGASMRARGLMRSIRRNPLATAIGVSFGKDTFFPPKIGLPPMPKGGMVGKRTAG